MKYEKFKSTYFWFFAFGSFSQAVDIFNAPDYVGGMLSVLAILYFIVNTTLLVAGWNK